MIALRLWGVVIFVAVFLFACWLRAVAQEEIERAQERRRRQQERRRAKLRRALESPRVVWLTVDNAQCWVEGATWNTYALAPIDWQAPVPADVLAETERACRAIAEQLATEGGRR